MPQRLPCPVRRVTDERPKHFRGAPKAHSEMISCSLGCVFEPGPQQLVCH